MFPKVRDRSPCGVAAHESRRSWRRDRQADGQRGCRVRKFERTTWDRAIRFAADRFSQIVERYGPDSVAGLSSARCTNEDNFVFQKFMRAAIGTNNVDHCAKERMI